MSTIIEEILVLIGLGTLVVAVATAVTKSIDLIQSFLDLKLKIDTVDHGLSIAMEWIGQMDKRIKALEEKNSKGGETH